MDYAVEAFAGGVGDSVPEVRQEVGEVLLQHLGDLDDRRESAPGSPGVPAAEEGRGALGVGVPPEPPELLLDRPRTSRLQIALSDCCEPAGMINRQVLLVVKPELPSALESVVIALGHYFRTAGRAG